MLEYGTLHPLKPTVMIRAQNLWLKRELWLYVSGISAKEVADISSRNCDNL